MCGRFSLRANIADITQQFSLTQNVVLRPRYNIAPGQVVPIIRTPGSMEFISWGLRPKWLKPEHAGFINARIETLREKPAFRKAFKQQRCLVIADGYYEWKTIGRTKQPFFIRLPQDQVFAFAGLYDLDTCTIITMQTTHPQLLALHERTPLILSPENYTPWLDPKTSDQIIDSCMHNTLEADLQFFPVSTTVNNPKNDSAVCVRSLQ